MSRSIRTNHLIIHLFWKKQREYEVGVNWKFIPLMFQISSSDFIHIQYISNDYELYYLWISLNYKVNGQNSFMEDHYLIPSLENSI